MNIWKKIFGGREEPPHVIDCSNKALPKVQQPPRPVSVPEIDPVQLIILKTLLNDSLDFFRFFAAAKSNGFRFEMDDPVGGTVMVDKSRGRIVFCVLTSIHSTNIATLTYGDHAQTVCLVDAGVRQYSPTIPQSSANIERFSFAPWVIRDCVNGEFFIYGAEEHESVDGHFRGFVENPKSALLYTEGLAKEAVADGWRKLSQRAVSLKSAVKDYQSGVGRRVSKRAWPPTL